MTQNRKVTLAVSLMVSAVSLAGCGGGGAAGVAPTTSGFGNATENVQQQQPSGPVFRGSGIKVFAAGGKQQIVVKLKPGAVMASRPNLATVRSIAKLRAQVLAVQSGDVNSVLQQLRSDPAVQYAEPNLERHAFDLPSDNADKKPTPGPYPSTTPPNDTKYGDQYGPKQIHAPEAWTKTKGSNVVIAIVDTGIAIDHAEFAGKIVPGFAASDTDPQLTPPEKDGNGHGTHCAGISAALTNNGNGIAGVAPDAKLMPVKVLSDEGSGSDAGVAEGILFAADNGANVISMSLGGAGESQVLGDAVKYALDKGVIVVAAMGNDGDNSKSYPAAYPGVIAVGATDKNGKIANFSQYGDWISVSAPGVAILSTFPDYKVDLSKYGFPLHYAVLDGTSMATPHVSGLVALVHASQPGLKPADVKKRIEQQAQRQGGKFDIHFGWGIVDAYKSI